MIDLHVHSNKSDGSYSPSELVDYAIEKNLSAFALTDHDTVAGLAEAVTYAKGKNIDVIPGIELSAENEGKEVHILGLYICYNNQTLSDKLTEFQTTRMERNEKMCQKMREAGLNITLEELVRVYPDAVITRGLFAKYLVATGQIKSMEVAFERYIGDHGPCYVPRAKITPEQAIALIHEAGGIAVLAHPPLYHMSMSKLDELVNRLKQAGLDGIEGIYTTYHQGEERDMKRLAIKYDLLITGGSDFHGTTKPKTDLAVGYGSLKVPDTILEAITARHSKILFTDLDGTLLTTDKKITSVTMDAIHDMILCGHKLVFSSGRPINSVLQVAKDYHFFGPGFYVSSYNGGLIYDCGAKKELLHAPIPMDAVRYLFDRAHEAGLHAHTYTATHVICEEETPELKHYLTHIKMPYLIADDVTTLLEEEPMKIIIMSLDSRQRLEAFRASLDDWAKDRLSSTFSSPMLLEYGSPAASKGKAIEFLSQHFSIPIDHTISAGDEENDLSMIKTAGVGVAMQNGIPMIKEAADYITLADNDHDAIAEIIHKFIL
ncbi:MAG: Cof-type HAD-IIB family hydrolase [Clostridia bacterium]|nr:Cof-type HAD-IIB family hydrolase [Clostridia bacterium]